MSDQTLSTSDLRAAAQDYKRDEDDKRKWAFGPKYTRGRGGAHPRPMRTGESDHIPYRHWQKRDLAGLHAGKAKLARKQDMAFASDEYTNTSEESNTSAEEDVESEAVAPDAQVMYSFDAFRAPTQGSQILNAALADAINKYEDNQTTKLVQNEYEILDAQLDEEEGLGVASGKGKGKGKSKGKGKTKIIDAEDQEYEFL